MSRNFAISLLALAACAPDLRPSAYAQYTTDGGSSTISCLPKLDGKIVASQMQPTIGVAAHYLVSPLGSTRSVNLTGAVNGLGNQEWDWSAPEPSDQVASISASPLIGKWYANSFPEGQYVVPIDVADTIEGVYRTTDSAVELHGIASTTQNPATGKTLIVYQAPVQLYQFPIEPGRSWTVSGTSRDAMLNGLAYA